MSDTKRREYQPARRRGIGRQLNLSHRMLGGQQSIFKPGWGGNCLSASDKVELTGGRPVFIYGKGKGYAEGKGSFDSDGSQTCSQGDYIRSYSDCRGQVRRARPRSPIDHGGSAHAPGGPANALEDGCGQSTDDQAERRTNPTYMLTRKWRSLCLLEGPRVLVRRRRPCGRFM